MGAGLPSVSVHVMVMDSPTRVVTFVAGLIVREGCTGEGGGEKVREGEGREGRKREEGREEREGREVGRWVGRLGETRRECSIVADEYLIKFTQVGP